MAQLATSPDAIPAPVPQRRVTSRGGAALQLILHNKVSLVGFAIFFGFILLAIFGPLLTSGETTTNVSQIYSAPSSKHILGTDYEGRDVLIQIVRGGRSIMIVGALAALLSTAFAVSFGALAALIRGW